MLRKFRKKPVTIEAVQWDGRNANEIAKLKDVLGTELNFMNDILIMETSQGKFEIPKGDWIMVGVKGEVYPCNNDVFERIHDEIITHEDTHIDED